MLKTIAVPLDGSRLAERALALATALSIPCAAELLLLQVDPGAAPRDGVTAPGTYLDKTAADLRQRGFRVEVAELGGEPVARLLVQAAEEHDADLIVMSTHGRSGPARWLLGSVAETMVSHSPIPIMLQRAWDPGRRSMLLSDRPCVLMPVDGSEFAEAAMPAAASLADDIGAELLLLEVEPIAHDVLLAEEVVATSLDGQEYAPDVAVNDYLDALAQRMRSSWPGLTIRTRVECGDAAAAIVQATEDVHAAFVVMATHGRTGLQRFALGSVADGVLHRGRAPLVLVHPLVPSHAVA